jgi:hypothetical protein
MGLVDFVEWLIVLCCVSGDVIQNAILTTLHFFIIYQNETTPASAL